MRAGSKLPTDETAVLQPHEGGLRSAHNHLASKRQSPKGVLIATEVLCWPCSTILQPGFAQVVDRAAPLTAHLCCHNRGGAFQGNACRLRLVGRSLSQPALSSDSSAEYTRNMNLRHHLVPLAVQANVGVQILVRARGTSRTSDDGQQRPVFASVSTWKHLYRK